MKPETKNCRSCKATFVLDSEDFSFYEKIKVPPPTICPTCRFKWRALFRNEMMLYTGRKCSMCKKSIVSMYNPKSPYTVYCRECYQADTWDPLSYGREYDFGRPFFDQLKEVLLSVPKQTLFGAPGFGENIRSEYTNASAALKDCYFVFNTGPAENSLYARGIDTCNEVCDAYFCVRDEQSYEIVNVFESSKIFWSDNLKGCVACYLSEDLSGCVSCFGCVGLRNKSNCIYNEQVSKEEFDAFITSCMGSEQRLREEQTKFKQFRLKFPKRENHNIKTLNSTGDYLRETKNVRYSFELRDGGEDASYCFACKGPRDSSGIIGYGVKSESLLEVVSTGNSSHVIGSYAVDQSSNMEYCFSCLSNNHDCMGCDGLKNAEYCILNKQYSKEEYERLREHIVRELTEKGLYGLMMPPELAPFKYNETIGQDNFPLTKEEALAEGLGWEDNIQETHGKETLKPEDIPDHIMDVADSITNEVLVCEATGRNYKISPQELEFYRKLNIPIPRKSFYARHTDRLRRRGPYQFWNRHCDHCKKNITTNYAPDRPEIIYCEECYQREVI